MSKEKILSLSKYLVDLNNKLSAPVPSKHTHRVASYKRFLQNEIKTTTAKIDGMKLVASDSPKGK